MDMVEPTWSPLGRRHCEPDDVRWKADSGHLLICKTCDAEFTRKEFELKQLGQ